MSAADPAVNATSFQTDLMTWYRHYRRSLPWREEPSPYKTVVSEFMLQQTQVKTVLPYFARWMEACPDFHALADLPAERVQKLWEGLGYYSRARNLHRLAQAIAAMPEIPRDPAAWLELPGVGPYTAAAITSIAFGARAACVDGNVVRILARLTADPTEYRDSASAAKAYASLASELLSPTDPGDHNQAMMELGATVCVRHNPLCTVCPVVRHCAAARSGQPESFPRLTPKKLEKREVDRAWCLHKGRLLLHRAAADAKRLANLFELPTFDSLGLSARAGKFPTLAVRKRGITRFAITETIRQLHPSAQQLADWSRSPELAWFAPPALEEISLSGPHRRWVRELLSRPDAAPSA